MTKQTSLSQSLIKTAAITGALLLIPLAAGLVSNDVNWTPFDFIFAGLMIFGTGAAYALIKQQSNSILYRIASGLGLCSALFLLWVNLAVGVIGSEDNVGNLMYLGVLVIFVVGVIASGFKPRQMAYALFLTALVQGVTIPVAIKLDMQSLPESSVMEILSVNGLFIVLFSLSGGLFLRASEHIQTTDLN